MGAKKNITLVKAECKRCFKDWYLYLVYEYDDESGKHRQIFPHIVPPFFTNFLPDVTSPFLGDCLSDRLISTSQAISSDREMVLKCAYPVADDVPAKNRRDIFKNDPGYFYNIIIEEAPKEMSIADIQDILGYKIKIVADDCSKNGWEPYPTRG